jgi:hypothetical protein
MISSQSDYTSLAFLNLYVLHESSLEIQKKNRAQVMEMNESLNNNNSSLEITGTTWPTVFSFGE